MWYRQKMNVGFLGKWVYLCLCDSLTNVHSAERPAGPSHTALWCSCLFLIIALFSFHNPQKQPTREYNINSTSYRPMILYFSIKRLNGCFVASPRNPKTNWENQVKKKSDSWCFWCQFYVMFMSLIIRKWNIIYFGILATNIGHYGCASLCLIYV